MTHAGFRPAGLLTLTTDFGLADPFVGIMKGRILASLPDARIVDLVHELPPHRADLAGFWLGRAWQDFPAGTVHLAVVDPGVGTERQVLLAETGEQCFLAPDNGLLPEALRGRETRWRGLDPGLAGQISGGHVSRTFHGRDLFAPLAAELASGRLGPAGFGPVATPADPAPLPRPKPGPEGIDGVILLADRFGNLFTNIPAALVEELAQPVVGAAGHRLPVLPTYGAAPPGTAMGVVNAFGLLEVAVSGGRADRTLGLAPGDTVRITDGIRI